MLNQIQFKAVVQAISTVFDQNELASLLLIECKRRLDTLVALPMPWGPLVTQVVQRAEMEEFTPELVLAVAAWRPRNVVLAAVLRDLTQAPGSAAALAVSPALQGPAGDAMASLQGKVRTASGYADFDTFLSHLAAIGPRMCRIESADDASDAVGTGFLVGPDLVLTNDHVRRLLGLRGAAPACRFDHVQIAGGPGVRAGTVVAARTPEPWVAWRPYADSDIREGGSPPTAEQLDYALLRLADPVARFPPGRDQEGDTAAARGHFTLRPDAAPLQPGEDLIVVQHPAGAPLKLALGSVLPGPMAHRCAHDAPTEKGTSGAAVLDLQLRLRALHHATDPHDPQRPRFNQAVPIGLIAADLLAQGKL